MNEVKITESEKAQMQAISRDVSKWLLGKGFSLADPHQYGSPLPLEEGRVITNGQIGILLLDKDEKGRRYFPGYLAIRLNSRWVFHLFGEKWIDKAKVLASDLITEFNSEIEIVLEDRYMKVEYKTPTGVGCMAIPIAGLALTAVGFTLVLL